MEYITFLTEMSLLGFAQTPCNEAAKFVSWNRRKEICFVFCVDLSMNERIQGGPRKNYLSEIDRLLNKALL